MQVAIPHELARAEVRRRLKSSGSTIGDAIPGGMAEVTTSWPSKDRMALEISAMGHNISGHVDIADHEVVFVVDLPMMLSFVSPMVESAIRSQGQKLLAPPAG